MSRLHVDVTQSSNKQLWWIEPSLICMYGQSLRGHVVITQAVLCDPGLLSWAEKRNDSHYGVISLDVTTRAWQQIHFLQLCRDLGVSDCWIIISAATADALRFYLTPTHVETVIYEVHSLELFGLQLCCFSWYPCLQKTKLNNTIHAYFLFFKKANWIEPATHRCSRSCCWCPSHCGRKAWQKKLNDFSKHLLDPHQKASRQFHRCFMIICSRFMTPPIHLCLKATKQKTPWMSTINRVC